eukprot:TRINITY_DN28802_c0_g1_i1.p1 TRINITY_DN28802_c0_g1~~TRINITY_DN28802_c0_g1_i1.p1  ORF type:complete len:264 (-),score=31.99 TRINITY_DN28802_c0_g1_i1:205-894(-)
MSAGTSASTCLLSELKDACGPFTLRPRQYLVAWSGVIVLAYDGWPAEVEMFKDQLLSTLPLKPENPGSVWPKTSLAALRDGMRLEPQQLEVLKQICADATNQLLQTDWSLDVKTLCSTTFACRSQERLLCSVPITLGGRPGGLASPTSKAYVDKVIDEYKSEDYWLQASRDGSRESHYRGAVLGNSLVAFITDVPPGMSSLRSQVDAALPGCYEWFSEISLHCTIRGLS